jgi:hypothetical protein
MADFPTMTKTWYTQANVPYPSSGSATEIAKSFWFNVKTLLCNENTSGTLSTSTGTRPSSSVWQVVSSSNGTSHGATDHWGTVYNSSNIVSSSAASSHSWCILKNTTNGYHLLLDLNSTAFANGRISAASGAIAGGSLASPNVTSETFILGSGQDTTSAGNTYIADTITGAGFHYMHFSVNENGEFIILLSRSGQNLFYSLLAFVSLHNPDVDDRRNYIFLYDAISTGRGAGRPGSMNSSVGYAIRRTHNGSLLTAGGLNMVDAFGNASWATYTVDALSGKYLTAQMRHGCLTPQFYFSGDITDFFYCSQAANCASVPSTSNQQWVLSCNVLVPMTDVVPIT